MIKKKFKGFEKLAIKDDLDFLKITRKDKKGRIISKDIEVY